MPPKMYGRISFKSSFLIWGGVVNSSLVGNEIIVVDAMVFSGFGT